MDSTGTGNENNGYTELLFMLGNSKPAWDKLISFINHNYEMQENWDAGKLTSKYYNELKFRRGGKTLITLYLREGYFEANVVLGKTERDKFEQRVQEFSPKFCEIYENTKIYHDGKWLWIHMCDEDLIDDITKLLLLKRRPNRKTK